MNAHLASLSGFATWVAAHEPAALPHGNPGAKVADLPLPPLEPRALTAGQVRSLKNVLDRLERFHQHKGRTRRGEEARVHGHGRPLRDRAIVYLLLSTGLRRKELVRLDLEQLQPNTPDGLRTARKAKISGVRGKGRTSRHVYVSADARTTLAEPVLTAETGNDAYELQRRLGHASQRYIDRYTNPPEDIAASYIEGL